MTPWLAQTARRHPERPALYWKRHPHTYRELARDASRRAGVLDELGIDTTSRVVAIGTPSLEWIRAMHAVLWRGATFVPLDDRWTDAELEGRLEALDPDLTVVDDESPSPIGRRSLSFAELADRATHRDHGFDPVEVDASSVATIFATSGTTGEPKLVPLTWSHHAASASASAFNMGVAPDDRWLACLPLHHVGGMAIVFRSCLYGTAFDLLDGFEAERVRDYLRDAPVTRASFVPTMLRRLVEAGLDAPESLRTVLVGGGPADTPLLEAVERRDLPVSPTWGMTETASQFATVPPDRSTTESGDAGPPLMGGDLRIVDESNEPLPDGRRGHVQVRGPMVFDGYLDRPDLNRTSFEHGWFCTGDVGRIDARGHLVVDARASARISSGGEAIDPREVESALRTHPGVRDACVVGLDDPEWGEVVAAAVAVDDASISDEALTAHCRDRLASYKCPKHWRRLESLPRTPTCKVERRRVREAFQSSNLEE